MKGIKVTGHIRPVSLLDNYPTHLDNLGKGGIHSVASLIEREAIFMERRSLGMMAFDAAEKSMYALLSGMDNTGWIEIFNFKENQLNFNNYCPPDYILLGNANSVPRPSPVLIDMRQDIIDLKRNVGYLEGLKKLEYNRLWIGDSTNRAVARLQIGIANLPTLAEAVFPNPLSNLTGDLRIPNPTFDYLSLDDRIMSSPYLPQVFATEYDSSGNPVGTEVSSALAMTQIKAAQIIKRFDNANFIVGSSTVNFEWENFKMGIFPVPESLRQLYGLGTSYTFTKAQSLGALTTGLLKNTVDVNSQTGTLSTAVAGMDYIDVAASVGNMSIAMIHPENLVDGNDNNKFLSRVSLSDAGIADKEATYVLNIPDVNLPNSQALNLLGSGILKIAALANGTISIASGGKVPVVNDYVRPIDLEEEVAALEEQILTAITGVESEITSVAGLNAFLTGVTSGLNLGYINYSLSQLKLVVNEGPNISDVSHIEGSGYLNRDGGNSVLTHLTLKESMLMYHRPQQYFDFWNIDNLSGITLQKGTKDFGTADNLKPINLSFQTYERHFDLLQPDSEYKTFKGFDLISEYGYGGDAYAPARFILQMLKYKDNKYYQSNPTEVEEIFAYERNSDVINFQKDARFLGTGAIKIPVGKKMERPVNAELGMIRYNTEI